MATKTRATLRFSSCPARKRNHSSSAGTPQEKAARSCFPSGSIALIMRRSAEQMAMSPQRFDKTRSRIRFALDRGKKVDTVLTGQDHALMLIEQPTRALVREISGGQTGHRHCLLDHPLG